MLKFTTILATAATCAYAKNLSGEAQDNVPTWSLNNLSDAQAIEFGTNGREVSVGQAVRFSVRGNPTTGYVWRSLNLDKETGIASDGITSVTRSYVMDEIPEEGWVGVGGTYYFTVEGLAVGESSLHIYQAPVWHEYDANRNIAEHEVPIHVI